MLWNIFLPFVYDIFGNVSLLEPPTICFAVRFWRNDVRRALSPDLNFDEPGKSTRGGTLADNGTP